jgi:hypothetical protein
LHNLTKHIILAKYMSEAPPCDIRVVVIPDSLPRSAVIYNDLHTFDLSTRVWTLLSPTADISARYGHGFTSAAGRLYVHGGAGWDDRDGQGDADDECLLRSSTSGSRPYSFFPLLW